jgi:hypothetical protein
VKLAKKDQTMTFEEALLDPSKFFSHRREIAEAEGLTLTRKVSLLKRWENDSKLLQVATNEGMFGGEQPQLTLIRREIKALRESQAEHAQ